MAMRIKRYGAERIAQYGRSRATLDATGCRHRASIHPVSPRWTPWSSISAETIELWHCGNRFSKLAFKKLTLYSAHQSDSVERLNATIKAEELSQLSSYQMLTTEKKSLKLPITKEAHSKVDAHEHQ